MKTKPFSELLEDMSPERRERIRKKTEELRQEMLLDELRKALMLTQEDLACSLNIKQATVSKIERQSDMYISTLRRFLSAMGAELKIIAAFHDDHEIEITQFEDISQKNGSRPGPGLA